MLKLNESEKEYRFGDSGPKYLVKGPMWEGGLVAFKKGQGLGLHLHNKVEETFYIIEGDGEMIIDGKSYNAEAGDIFKIEPGERHNMKNNSDTLLKAFFIKCPFLPEDKVNC